jgi:S-adenosylmethionine-dependent methyltransferase
MRTFETTQFQDAEKYAAYLKTSLGRLRSDLTWENLRVFLPSDPSAHRVLDLGGGTGSMSLRVAKKGFTVVLLDSSEEMLEIAKKDAAAAGIAAQISFRHDEASRLPELFAAESFAVIVCHNVLEFLAAPETVIAKIAHVLRGDGIVSVLVRNHMGEVLKAAVKSANLESAKALLSTETVLDSLYGKPVRLFEPQVVVNMLSNAGLEVIAQRGVRVIADYWDHNDFSGESAYEQMLDLELILGARPEFAGIARYTQMIARRSNVSARPGDTR